MSGLPRCTVHVRLRRRLHDTHRDPGPSLPLAQEGEPMMELRNRSTEIGGCIDLLATAEPTAELIPTLGARANSAAPLSPRYWAGLLTQGGL